MLNRHTLSSRRKTAAAFEYMGVKKEDGKFADLAVITRQGKQRILVEFISLAGR